MAAKNARNFEFKLGKQGLVLFILGMSLLLFGVFLFGVTVGKHLDAYPEVIARGIPDMIGKKLGIGKDKNETDVVLQGAVEDPGDTEEGEFDLTFYETLTKKSGGNAGTARSRKPGGEKAKVPAAAPGSASETADAPSPRGEMRAEKTNGNHPAPPVSGDAGPGSSGAETAPKEYLIHVASFREKGKADRLAKRLAALGHTTVGVRMREVPGRGTWFRVIMTDFKTREEAQRTLDAVDAGIRGLKAKILVIDRKKD